MYFVIRNSDGDTTVEPYSKEQLTAALNNEEFSSYRFLDSIPAETDTNYWGEVVLIIKGTITVPEPIESVTVYKV